LQQILQFGFPRFNPYFPAIGVPADVDMAVSPVTAVGTND